MRLNAIKYIFFFFFFFFFSSEKKIYEYHSGNLLYTFLICINVKKYTLVFLFPLHDFFFL